MKFISRRTCNVNDRLFCAGIIERVKVKESPPFRPAIENHSPDSVDVELSDLMRTCWEEIPAFRPNFNTIRDGIKKMNKGR